MKSKTTVFNLYTYELGLELESVLDFLLVEVLDQVLVVVLGLVLDLL